MIRTLTSDSTVWRSLAACSSEVLSRQHVGLEHAVGLAFTDWTVAAPLKFVLTGCLGLGSEPLVGVAGLAAPLILVITYGTYDLLRYGHINLLRRAKGLSDYLIVVLSADGFDWNEKRKKCYFSYEERKLLLEAIRYVDLVIPEESWGQKRTDVHEYRVDTFVIGGDWEGKFDFFKEEGCEVVYLPRTPEISSSQMKMT